MEAVNKEVIDGVINACKGMFAEDGVDEQVLDELKQMWEEKVKLNTKVKEVTKEKKIKPDLNQASSSGVKQVNSVIVPVQVKLPPSATQPARMLCLNVPASSLQNNKLQQLLTGSIISATLNLPVDVATAMLQEHINLNISKLVQIDGTDNSSDEDCSVEMKSEDEEEEQDDDESIEIQSTEDEPLNSDDDVTDEDIPDLYETDNIVVCQYDKVGRSKNKWKFLLKDGILHFKGSELPFHKAIGEAEW